MLTFCEIVFTFLKELFNNYVDDYNNFDLIFCWLGRSRRSVYLYYPNALIFRPIILYAPIYFSHELDHNLD